MRKVGTVVLCVLLALVTTPSGRARTRKGDGYLKQGRDAEVRRQWEMALDYYEKAMLEDPGDSGYQIASRRVRFQAAMTRVNNGQKLRTEGKLEEALAEFQKGYAIDPGSGIAEQEIRRTRDMIEREKTGKSPTPEIRGMTPGERAVADAEERSSRMLAVPELRPITRQISSLRMNNQPVRVLFETLGKLAGINVVLDSEYTPPPGRNTFTVDLSNTTLEEALDYLAIQTKSYWKPLSANTIFVTNDNPTKRRDYEDNVVKVFYIKNATTTQELQEIATSVRTVTDIRRSFVYNGQNAILVKGTTDQVALAEKLFQDLDKPRAEVVIDVIVMEANRSRVRDISATFLTSGAAGIRVPVSYNGAGSTGGGTGTGSGNNGGGQNGTDGTGTGNTGNGTGTGTGNNTGSIRLPDLLNLGTGDFSIAAPGALLQLVASDAQTRIIQQPQVRAVETFKASLRIGDKIPYASGSYQPGVGSVGVSPLVQTQFNFFDVGVNVDITPKVHGKDEISLQIELDISSLAGRVEIGGVAQPQIRQSKVNHSIRLKEGEVTLLGGLIRQQDDKNLNGIPGLINIPILRWLFGTESTNNQRGELLIALVPHIVRTPDYTDVNLKGISAGNETNIQLKYQPRPEQPSAAPPIGQPPPTAAPPATPVPVVPQTPPAPATTPALAFAPFSIQAPLSAPVTVTLNASNMQDLYMAPLKLKFDPKILRLTSVKPGGLLTGDNQKINFGENIMNDTGEATIKLNRVPGSGGVSGSGALLVLTFDAIGKGTSAVTVTENGLMNMQLQPIAVQSPAVSVAVQ